jgi:hypothetical protein
MCMSIRRTEIACLIAIISFLYSASEARSLERTAHVSDISLDKSQIVALIDSLANRNRSPEEVAVRVRFSQGKQPLFDASYDWTEDNRIRNVASVLVKFDGDLLWICLMEHLDDQRYSLPFILNETTYAESIGGLCWRKAADDLDYPFARYIPSDLSGNIDRVLRIRALADLKAWYKEHLGLRLYEQQIARCEDAVKKIDSVNTISSEDKRKFVSTIQSQIAQLKQSKTPIVGTVPLIPKGAIPFGPDKATAVREAFEKMSK